MWIYCHTFFPAFVNYKTGSKAPVCLSKSALLVAVTYFCPQSWIWLWLGVFSLVNVHKRHMVALHNLCYFILAPKSLQLLQWLRIEALTALLRELMCICLNRSCIRTGDFNVASTTVQRGFFDGKRVNFFFINWSRNRGHNYQIWVKQKRDLF